MLQIAVCDEDTVVCAQIEEIMMSLQDTLSIKIETEVFYSAEALYHFLAGGDSVDLIFLDIEFEKVGGIEIGRKIREEMNDELIQIIYISEKESYAMELFESRPLNFLIKPLQEDKIEKAVRKTIELIDKENRFFEFRKGRNFIRIPFKDILYFESNGKKVRVITQKEEHEFYAKLSDIAQRLSGKQFLQIHKSFLINYYHVVEYNYESVMLTNKEELVVSQQNRKSISDWILKRRNSIN